MTLSTEDFNELKDYPVSGIIQAYETCDELKGENFRQLQIVAVDNRLHDKASYKEYLFNNGEIQVLRVRSANGEKVVTKTGKWMVSKVCESSTYSSNKAVIASALDAGYSMLNTDGRYRTKKELEDLIKGGKAEKSDFEKASHLLATAGKIISKGNLTAQQSEAINTILDDLKIEELPVSDAA